MQGTPPIHRAARTLAGRRFGLWLAARFDAHLHGRENVPREGGALLVGNHTLFGLDSFPLTALLATEVGRVPRFLGERNLWRLPLLSLALDVVGAIPGEREGAVELLRKGELVCVYPGGVDDSFKTRDHAYELRWADRAGFARVAIRAGVPIVPIAATGIDELFEVRRREHVVGRTLLGSPRYDLPIPRNLAPKRARLDYHALSRIETRGLSEKDDVERVRRATFDAIEGVLAPYRARLREAS